ncbi:MAG TPA: hypothetical protein VM754_03355 [Actinomycetota bacterium]|nr:hypothetical protein [Actinomycetota bacterium]
MAITAPVEFTYAMGRAQAVNRRFLSWFWGFAITFAVAAFYRPAITAFSVCLPILVLAWARELKRAPRPGWVLAVSPTRMTLNGGPRLAVERDDAARVHLRSRGSRRARWTELVVVDGRGRTRFRTAVDDSDRAGIAEALQALEWPLEA